MSPASDLSAIRLPRNYDVELLQRDLQTLQEVRRAPQPGPYHKGEWTGIALYSMGGKQSTFPSAAGTEHYQETEELQSAPYFRQILRELECPKEVVRILFLPPEGHIKDHFDFHTSFQFGLLRLHIPIVTHPDVIFIIDGQQVAMNPGELWYGDFSKVHSVKNNSPVVRVHMVIDVQINDFVLSLFPEDFIARRRAEGISITTEPIPASEAELRRFACDFRIPGEFMPMFVIGKPLSYAGQGRASVGAPDRRQAQCADRQRACVSARTPRRRRVRHLRIAAGHDVAAQAREPGRERSVAAHERPAQGPLFRATWHHARPHDYRAERVAAGHPTDGERGRVIELSGA